MEGIATAVVGWNVGRLRLASAPRMAITRLSRGLAFGRPGDKMQQCRVLEATLALLEEDAPIEPLYVDEAM